MTNARILVVDDEPQIRRVMRVTLTAQGFVVTDARSGEEAVEKLPTLTCLCRTPSCCKRCGDPITGAKWNTCAFL